MVCCQDNRCGDYVEMDAIEDRLVCQACGSARCRRRRDLSTGADVGTGRLAPYPAIKKEIPALLGGGEPGSLWTARGYDTPPPNRRGRIEIVPSERRPQDGIIPCPGSNIAILRPSCHSSTAAVNHLFGAVPWLHR